MRQQVVQRRADAAHVDLDVRERRGAQRDHDVLGGRGVRHAVRERQPVARMQPLEQLVGAGLLEGHAPGLHGAEALGVVVDADHVQTAIGEGECEREADSA